MLSNDRIPGIIYGWHVVESMFMPSSIKVTERMPYARETHLSPGIFFFFVSSKLATLDGVRSTKTSFILKTYKEKKN